MTVSQTGLPATERILKGLAPNNGLLDNLGPFLEQLNPILYWLSLHQQLISDFITGAGATLFPRTTTFGGDGTGHYLRQFGPLGPETLGLAQTRDANNRGNDYPQSLWLPAGTPQVGTLGNLPAWDCANAGGPASQGGQTPGNPNGVGPNAEQPCWVQPKLPGASSQYKIPFTPAARYSTH